MVSKSDKLGASFQIVKESLLIYEFLVGSSLYYFPFFEDVDHVSVLDSLDSVGDRNGCLMSHDAVQGVLHSLFILSIERRCGFI